ncbi:MAG: hypothetical protein QXM86_02045 [Candidatus Bathyarchaeia archaeon]
MNTKLPAILSITIIALLTMGYSYACQNGGINIDCRCYCDLAFTNVTTADNEIEKDIAVTTAHITCDKNTIKVYITNAYPSYEAHITYTIKNTGKRPIQFTSLTTINPNPEALKITTTNHTSTWLNPSQTTTGTTTVHILQTAHENWQYHFQIKIGAKCKPKTCPRTTEFWKSQLTQYLGKQGNPQIPPETLENNLNQINAQSTIFKFTGTRTQKFQQALRILEMPKNPTTQDKLKAQLLALWLNYMEGYTEDYTINDMTAQQIIANSENALRKHQTNQYEYWKNLCEKFNNLNET